MKLNMKIDEVFSEQFPKGDKVRGRALVLQAVAQNEFNDLQKAFDMALEENNRLRKKIEDLTGGKGG